MPDLLIHESISPEEVHRPYSFIFSNQDERLNSTLPTSLDIGKLALVTSDHTIWLLVNYEPLTWKECLTGDSGTRPVGPALGDLQGEFPYPSIVPDSHLHTPGVSIPSYPITLPPSGPAGGHLKGSYPNPLLTSTGVVSGIYINPTITIDTTGRITSAISKEAGERNLAGNLGVGSPIYSYKDVESKSLMFRSISTEPHSGLQISTSEETLSLSTPGLAKLSGATFTGPVEAIDITADDITCSTINSPMFDGGATNFWVPDARNGMKQKIVVGSSITIDSILFAEPGMEFVFFIQQQSVPLTFSNFAPKYKFASSRTRTLSTKSYTTDVVRVVILDSNFYFTEILKDVG